MKNLSIYSKNVIVLLMAFVFSITVSNKLQAQSCNQVDILYTSIDCFERSTNPAGNSEKGCKETAVCFGQAYTYSSSLNGVGWTYNWTASGPTAVTISPSNTQSVSINWPQIGDFILTLTATDPSGNLFTTCLTVHVIERPNANFTFSPNNVCATSIITFTGTTTYSGSFVSSWDFGDLPSGSLNYQTVSGNTPVTHQYNSAGTYWVTLITSSFTVVTVPGGNGAAPDTVIKTCCSDTIKKLVTILAGTIKIDCISTVCAGSTSTYTITGCANPTVTVTGNTSFTQSGNQITVVWGNGTPQGQITASCPGSCTASVPVPIIPTTPQIIGNINPCNTSTTSYSLPVLPGTFYTWTLLNTTNGLYYNSAINTYPDNNTVWIKWNSIPAGVYQLGVTLENKHICCKTTGSLTITPRGKWKPYFDQTICAGSAASLTATAGGTYTWTVLPPNTGVAPTSGTGTSFNPTFANAGIYTVQAIETAGIFCNSGVTNPQQVKVTVRAPLVPGVIIGAGTVCAGSNYDYNMSTPAPAGTHYEWTITGGAGTFLPTGTPPIMGDNVTIKWTTIPGTISVVLKYNDYPPCPVGPVTKSVTAATVGTISGNQNVCVDDQFTYTLTGGTLAPGEVINWVITPSSLGSVILGNGTNTPTILWHGMAAGAGPWTAQLQATTNCGNSALYTITISRPPVFSISQTGNICMGGVNLSATNTPGYTYSWSPGVHPATSTINVTAAGTYTCTVTNGTCSKSKTVTIYDPFAILPIQECGGPHCNGLATSEQLQISVIKPASGTFTYQWFKKYPTPLSVSGPVTNTNLSNIYMAADSGSYFVVVTYGSCSDTAYYFVQKECCPDVNNPQINTVRNSCKQFTFTGTTPNPTGASITWDFGDGTTQPGVSGVPVTHTYVHAGSYCVTFCVGPPSTNPTSCYGNCAGTNVIVPIEAKFEYTLGCNGCVNITNLSTAIPLSGSSIITYEWNNGNGFNPPASTSPSLPLGWPCYTVAGTYNITLIIRFKDVTIPLVCSDTYTLPVTFTPLDITINPTPVCSGNLVTFTSTPGGFASYAWNFGDTYSSYTSPTTHAYTTPSPPPYNVTLTVIDQLGFTCTKTKSVTVLTGITSCTILPAFICPGSAATLTAPTGAYTYLWQVETSPGVFANAAGTNTNATYNTTIPGYYHVIVTNTNGCSCTSNKVQVKAVTKPKALIAVSPSTKLCGPSTVMLNSVNHLPGFTSEWYQNNVYAAPQTGQYWSPSISTTTVFNLVLTNQYGCKDTCTMTVYVNPIPAQPIISTPALLCEGVPITLTVTNYPTNITWNTGANTTSITVVAAGAYTATYTNPTTGCQSSQTVTIHPRPSTQLFPHFCDSIKCTCRNPDGTFTVYAPKPLVGIFANTYNIAWYYNGNLVGANANNPLFNPAQTGSYYVILTNPVTGCKDTSNTYSIVVPPCDTCDCKESHWGEISLSEGGGAAKLANGNNKTNTKEKNSKVANPLPNIVLDCKGVYTIKCNQLYTINANYICKDTSCPSKVTYSLLLPDNTVQTGNVPYSFTPTQTGNYALTLYGWCGGKICDSCLITFKVECTPPPKDCCKGSSWKEEPYYHIGATGTVKPRKIDCTKETAILITGDDCKKPLVVGAAIQCPTADCPSADSVFVYNNLNNIVLSGPAPLSIIGLPNGTYTVVVNGYCGGHLCLACKFIIKIDCKECECDPKAPLNIQLSINDKIKKIECGADLGVLNCKDNIVLDGTYTCNPKDCPAKLTYTLNGPGGVVNGTLPLTLSSLTPGSYSILIQAYCSGKLCKECKLTFTVECEKPCCPYEIKVTPKEPTYVANPTSTTVSNSFGITIPATANITEVRANVLSYTIDDNFKGDCMKCVNLPFTWASTATATNIATASPKITMYGGVTVPTFNGSGASAYQNPREIIWNNGTNLNSPNITNIGMSFILPPTPNIDCCELKGKICVKFTFRDDKCNECEAIGCFDFAIKK